MHKHIQQFLCYKLNALITLPAHGRSITFFAGTDVMYRESVLLGKRWTNFSPPGSRGGGGHGGSARGAYVRIFSMLRKSGLPVRSRRTTMHRRMRRMIATTTAITMPTMPPTGRSIEFEASSHGAAPS